MGFSTSKFLMAAIVAVAGAVSVSAENTYLDRSSWVWSASSSDTQDGGGTDALHDSDYSTFWHSNYHDDASHNCPHWVMIDRRSDNKQFEGFSYVPRQGSYNNMVTKFRVYLSSKPFGTVSSVDESVLGAPTYSGSFDSMENYDEKTFSFGKAHTERYVLFVIDMCNSGRSTAMAEFYLVSKVGSGGNSGGGGSSFNSVLIRNADGTDHRIAIDGEALNVTMSGRAIHMTNTGITIEYEIPEVKYFTFENYEFPEDVFYIGTKSDLNETPEPLPEPEPFDLVVTPASGSTIEGGFTSISFAHANGLELQIAGNESVTLSRGITPIFKWTPTLLKQCYDAETHTFTLSNLNCTTEGTYMLTVPSSLLVETDTPTNFNNPLLASFIVKEVNAINDVEVPTLVFKVEGSRLLVSGIGSGSEATLYSIGGVKMASAPVTPFGTAAIDVAPLAAGAYILSVDGKTFKITI